MISRFSSIAQPNIRHHQNNKIKNNSQSPSFKGAFGVGTQALNFLNTSPAIGACFVDFFSMVFPRTMVDFSRSKDAGLETGFRESSGTTNHAMAGIVGLGAGYLVSSRFNKTNGVKTHLMFMDEKAIDVFKNIVKSSVVDGKYDKEKYWKTFFSNIEGLNTSNSGNNIWHKIPEEVADKAAKIMADSGSNKYKVPSSTIAEISKLVIGETGAGSTFRVVEKVNGSHGMQTEHITGVKGSLKDLTGNANAMLKAVTDKAAKDGKNIVEDLEKFLKGVKNKKLATMAAGLSIPIAIGVSSQPFNRYLTKKRTGSDGFVGVEGREPDKSAGFKVLKTVVGLAMGSAMIATILDKPYQLYTKFGKAFGELKSKLQYKGMAPTIDQFKLIYGLTITSRIFAARDKNEVRESSIKDSLGFANWLILGGFVSKLAARAFNKDIINYNKEINGKGFLNFVSKSVEKTHEEILYPALEKMNINVLDEKGRALPFRKLIKIMKDKALQEKEFQDLSKTTMQRLKYKNYAQLLGYLYSGVVLGAGIPALNIAITKHCEKNAALKKTLKNQNEKMKLNNDFMQTAQKDNKTFGAFLKQI